MKKIVVTQALQEAGTALLAQIGTLTVLNTTAPGERPQELAEADAVIVRIGHLNAAEIAAAPKLAVIGRTGVGYDSVDVAAATARGIPIILTPEANADSVAEHTLAMLLALGSNLVEEHNAALTGNFAIRSCGRAFELRGKTLGVVGLGSIGKRVAALAAALGMRLIAFDPAMTAAAMTARGVEKCDTLTELLRRADAVTLHTPLDDSTRGFIGAAELALMKPSAVLINCARGGLVDEAALTDALRRGALAGAATDVFCKEPPAADDPFLHAPRLLISPHSAAQKREAVARMAAMCAAGCCAVLRGERWPYVANPDAYLHPKWEGSAEAVVPEELRVRSRTPDPRT